MSYSPEVLARVRTPQRIGALPVDDPSVAVGEAGTLESGTLARISIRVDARAERIDEVRFRVFGCSAAIASASLVSEWMEHAPLAEARRLTAERVVAALALPADREHVAELAVEAGRRAIASWEQRSSAEAGARSAGGSARRSIADGERQSR